MKKERKIRKGNGDGRKSGVRERTERRKLKGKGVVRRGGGRFT